MLEKLDSLLSRYEELCVSMEQPDVQQNYVFLQECLKERSSLQPVIDTYLTYLSVCRQLEEAREMFSDPLLADEARREAAELSVQKQQLHEELKMLLVPPDPLDNRNVIMEIRAGVGGEEAALFAGDLVRMYQKYCDRRHLQLGLPNLSETDLGGVSMALLTISGQDAYARFKFESGVHCVKRVPVTESGGRIHTSTVTVAVFPEAQEPDLTVLPSEIRTDVFHAGGHGGQGVNTTDSAVRLTHIPTGLVVICQDERSQLENKNKALKVLRSRLWDQLREKQSASKAEERRSQIGHGDRSERIRTYYCNHDYVVDHRLSLTVPRVANTLNGDLDPFIDALRLAEKTEQLQSLND